MYDPLKVEKTDHPDIVGGIVWADCELAWIRAYGTRCFNHGNARGMKAGKLLFEEPKVGAGGTAVTREMITADRIDFYANQIRGVPVAELGRKMREVLRDVAAEAWNRRASQAASDHIEDERGMVPVEYLLNGSRFKLSFQEVECSNCGHSTSEFVCRPLDQYVSELSGEWVALVNAENDKHMKGRRWKRLKKTEW